MKAQSKKSRRYKAVNINPDVLIQCFCTQSDGDWTNKILFPELPQDVQVESVHYDNMYMSFRVTLEHESFPVVPEHMMVPTIEARYEVVKMSRYRTMPLRRYPDPETQTQSIQRNEDGTIKEHICTLISWYDTEEEQMKRYGITGWDEKGVAIWEEGRGPQDGTIVVRSPQYEKHNFQSLVNGCWTSTGNEFFKREDVERVSRQMQDAEIKKTSEALYEAALGMPIKVVNDNGYKELSNPKLGVPCDTPIEDPFMKIWREKENQ